MEKKKMAIFLSSMALLVVVDVLPFALVGAEQAQAASTEPIKIGCLVPYTGAAAGEAKPIERGIQFALDEVGWQIAGRKITLIKEDQGQDPTAAVSKARKLVEQDKVDVILGPILAHTGVAVDAYLGPLRVPHVAFEASDEPKSNTRFLPTGTNRGNAYPSGLFAYDELGARKAVIIHQDFLFGLQVKDGFAGSFTRKGGSILSVQKVPLGTVDMAPYIAGLGNPDVICALLLTPSDVAFVRQYREFGVKAPIIFGSKRPQGEDDKLAQLGDNALGMYGFTVYSSLIDTPDNKQYVQKYKAKFGVFPGDAATSGGYYSITLFLQALRNMKGAITRDKITEALVGIKEFKTPVGTTVMQNRVGVNDVYAFKLVKIENTLNWQVVKKYPQVEPR